MQERGEVCLAEEVERLRQLGLSDEEVATRLGVDASWVETLVSPADDETTPDKASGFSRVRGVTRRERGPSGEPAHALAATPLSFKRVRIETQGL